MILIQNGYFVCFTDNHVRDRSLINFNLGNAVQIVLIVRKVIINSCIIATNRVSCV